MYLQNTDVPKLKVVDAESLIATPLPPVEFVVDSLVAQGLYLLVGDSKIGKSWLTLLLCIKVSQGEPFWGFKTRQSEVLYLCLEDNYNRLQARLLELTSDARRSLKLAIKAKDITHGLLLQIEDFVIDYPNAKLVVIDTLQKVRGAQIDSSGAYAADYRDMGLLKELADRLKIAILLIHHTSKRPNEKDDPFKKISGTTALMGASDGCFVMTKENPFAKNATFAVTGRDIECRTFQITQNENFIWELEREISQKELRKRTEPPLIKAVEQFIVENGDWFGTASQLSSFLEISLNEKLTPQFITAKINQYHIDLAERGIVYRTKRTSQQRLIFLSKTPSAVKGEIEEITLTCQGEHSCLSDTSDAVPLENENREEKII